MMGDIKADDDHGEEDEHKAAGDTKAAEDLKVDEVTAVMATQMVDDIMAGNGQGVDGDRKAASWGPPAPHCHILLVSAEDSAENGFSIKKSGDNEEEPPCWIPLLCSQHSS